MYKRQVYKKIRKITKQEVQKEEGVSLFERWKTAGYRDKKAVTAILVSHIIMYGDGSLEVVWNI